jgi:uncharacterized delta-60 repeat protein
MGYSQPLSLDASFNPLLNTGAVVYVVAVQPNGRIIIGGTFTSIGGTNISNIARLNTNGTLDTSFNPGTAADIGYVSTLAIQPDGRILAGGSFFSSLGSAPANLARLNSNGSVDSEFDSNLSIDGVVNSVVVQSDGGLVIGGGFTYVDAVPRRSIARLHSNGTLDMVFDACVASGAGSGATGLAVQSDGKILASGGNFIFNTGAYRTGIARLSDCGEIDTSYAGQQPGINIGSTAYTLLLGDDGKVVLGGSFNQFQDAYLNGIVRLTTNGTTDATFNPGLGITFGTTVYVLAMQPDRRLLIGGDFTEYNGVTRNRIARLNADGTLDPADPGLGPNNAVSSIVVQTDGKILVSGKFNSFDGLTRYGLARLNGDPPRPLLSQPVRLGNGQFQLKFSGESGTNYVLQSSSNLVDWVGVTNFTATNPPQILTDPSAGGYAKRFYRAVMN